MARIWAEVETEAYRNYIADALWVIPQNKAISKRYSELMNGLVVEQKSGDEIAAEVIKNAGLVLV